MKRDNKVDKYYKDRWPGGVNDGSPIGTAEATKHEPTGGFAASGVTESSTYGSHGDPTDSANMSGATTGAGVVPGLGVRHTNRAGSAY